MTTKTEEKGVEGGGRKKTEKKREEERKATGRAEKKR